jgi:2-polyprenyl-6-methoxyphenol hydroxylase-like FAD-dependent oxidoreductase
MVVATTAAVIGGGIAGPVAAIALRKAGIEATIFEAYDEAAHGIGGELMLAPNGMAALSVIDAATAVEAVGIPTPRMVMETGTGKRLGEFHDLPGLPTSRLFARADLYRALLEEAAGIPVSYGKRLVGYSSDGTGVTATFADGSTVTADVLIGADGIRSTVRTLLDPHAPSPRYVGLLGCGAWVPADGLAQTGGAMHFAFGRRGFFGYAVDDRHAGWFANLPSAEPLTAADAHRIPDETWLRRLKDLFADDTLPALAMIDRVRPGELVNVGAMHDMPPVPVWHRDRVVLVGDAAHATSPSSGQGASLAIESAVVLARCLRDLPIDQAFAAYEELRRPRVERVIARTARINADKAPGRVGRIIRDLTFPIAMRTFYRPEKMMGWMHRYTIDWNAAIRTATPASG